MNCSMTDIITRKQAKEQGLKFYFTGKECCNGHVDKRMTSNGKCMTCALEYKKTSKSKEHYKTYRKNHRDKVNERSLAYYYKRYQEPNRELRRTDPDEAYKHSRQWAKENPDKIRATTAKRRSQINKSVPLWYDHDKVKEIYKQCRRISKETGVVHHVDHIVPLRGELVCGLHCDQNLQIITAEENMKKGNQLLEEFAS